MALNPREGSKTFAITLAIANRLGSSWSIRAASATRRRFYAFVWMFTLIEAMCKTFYNRLRWSMLKTARSRKTLRIWRRSEDFYRALLHKA